MRRDIQPRTLWGTLLLLACALGCDTLTAPSSLRVTATTSTTIDLVWADNTTQEAGYSVERSQSATSGFVTVASLTQNATTYRDSGLASSTHYYYRVRAVGAKSDVYSPYSNVADAVTLADTTLPGVPTGLKASPVSCNRIDLVWTGSTDAGGSGLLGYNVYRQNAFLAQVAAPATSTADTSVSGGATYSYAVAAVDKAGNVSNKTALVTATTPTCAPSTTTTTTLPSLPPVANAGPDQVSQTLMSIAFSGSSS